MPTDDEYRRLLDFRTQLRRLEAWSQGEAEKVGLTQAQHQLLLVIRGQGNPAGPTIGEAAELLLVRHHTAVELADRTEALGLIQRVADAVDHRRVRLILTELGLELLAELSSLHLEEIRQLAGWIPVDQRVGPQEN